MSLEKPSKFLQFFSGAKMNGSNKRSYRFKSFLLNVSERQLFDADRPVALTPKSFDTLVHLVARAGHLVEKEELMQAVWPDSVVEEANISRAIHDLRKGLGQDKNGNKFIETVPTKGYRFVVDVTEVEEAKPSLGTSKPDHALLERDRPAPAEPAPNSGRHVPQRTMLILAGLLGAVLLVVLIGYSSGYRARSVGKKIAPETASGEALQNYTQGKFLIERRHEGDYEKALAAFEHAIELDPDYANAYAGKADAKLRAFWQSSGSHLEISQAGMAIRKAIELDGANLYAHTVQCRILTTYYWEHAEAEKECRTAVELDANSADAARELAFLLHSLGRESEALAAIDNAVAIAPSSFNKRSRGLILYQARRYDEAILQLEQVEATDPLYDETGRWIIVCYEMKRDYVSAFARYLKLLEQSGATADEIAALKVAFDAQGWPAVLRNMIDRSRANSFQAGCYAQLGDKENSFATLEAMLKRRAVNLVQIGREPALDPLRDDPRFAAILATINLK